MIRAFILTFLLSLLLPASSYADSNLRFKKPENHKENKAIEAISQKSSDAFTSYKIAPIDLNDDLIDEYIVTLDDAQKCTKNNLCPYYIIAFAKYEPLMIGQFDAHKILVSSKKTYGINDIIVYNNTHNDFQTTNARWNPFSFTYKVN